MKTTALFILSILFFGPSVANDGAYLSSGGIISPMKETRIAMTKEFLAFTVRDKIAKVEVLFEFMNPDAEERTLLVGFQAPAAGGDVPDEVSSVSQIKDFRIQYEGRLLPYTLKVADCEDCPLLDPSERFFTQSQTGIFVYLFELTFKPGLNNVQHSYEFPASNDVYTDQKYNYILRTGSKWADSSIGEFTLQVDMGSNQYFYVSDVFGANANWSIIGTGKIAGEQFEDYRSGDQQFSRMVRTLSGKLIVTVRNLRPDNDIAFGVIGPTHDIYLSPIGHNERLTVAMMQGSTDLSSFQTEPLTKEDLRVLRNTIYAQHGYRFADKDLQELFSQFDWYIPDPNLRMDQIQLSDAEQRFIGEIMRKEKG